MARLARAFRTLVFALLFGALLVWWGSMLLININADRIRASLETELGPGCEVSEVKGDVLRGLILTGTTLREAEGGSVLLQAAMVRITPDWMQLLRGQIGLKGVTISDVTINVERGSDGTLLLPPVLTRAATAQGATFTFDALSWSLQRAEIRYHGESADGAPLLIPISTAHGSYRAGKRFQIDAIRGHIADSPWTLAGTVTLDEARTLSGFWELKDAGILTLALALSELSPSTRASSRFDSATIPSGLISGKLSIGGTLSDPEVSGRVNLTDGALRHFRLDHGELTLKWRPGVLTLTESVLKAYEGRIAATGAIDFRANPPSYTFDARSAGIQLGEFLDDAGFGKIKLSGKFAGSFTGHGPLTSVERFSGAGELTATYGATANPLYDPVVSGQPETLPYESLTTQVTVADQSILLTNTALQSTEATLAGSGTIGFDGDLNCRATLTAPARLMENHPLYGPTIRLLGLGDTLVPMTLDVGGTLATPDVRTHVDESALRTEAGQSLMDRVRGFFGGQKKEEGAGGGSGGE